MDNKKIKRILEIVIYVLTCIASFVGGQASAKNGYVDLFGKSQIEIHK